MKRKRFSAEQIIAAVDLALLGALFTVGKKITPVFSLTRYVSLSSYAKKMSV